MNVPHSLLIIHHYSSLITFIDASVSLCALRVSVVKSTTEAQSARRITEMLSVAAGSK
jgi:hypothetical protein